MAVSRRWFMCFLDALCVFKAPLKGALEPLEHELITSFKPTKTN